MRTLLKSEKIRQNLDAVAAAEYFTYVTAMTYFSIGNTIAPEFSRYDANRRIYISPIMGCGNITNRAICQQGIHLILNGDRDKE